MANNQDEPLSPASLPDGRRFLNDRLDWNLLRTYLVIVQEGSVSRAAARLHLTQPAVSKRIAALELQLELRLFDRIGREVSLTEAGRA
ncbi:LysR family transcriptional regulator, partial [Streptomyces sp. CHB19.2]|nr:LysR family transcriptional regulator [Streptomyces sp. CHB19.2]